MAAGTVHVALKVMGLVRFIAGATEELSDTKGDPVAPVRDRPDFKSGGVVTGNAGDAGVGVTMTLLHQAAATPAKEMTVAIKTGCWRFLKDVHVPLVYGRMAFLALMRVLLVNVFGQGCWQGHRLVGVAGGFCTTCLCRVGIMTISAYERNVGACAQVARMA